MIQTQLIYCGDNLQKLRELPDECVDLIYIDPPFNSNRNYEVFWGDTKEKRSFEDRFGDVEHYIHWMRPRISELYRVLKPTGTLYYHCDWHAGAYVKVMLDQQFGFNHFLNEVIWCYNIGGKGKKHWARKHDNLYFYAKGKKWFFDGAAVGIKRETGTKSFGGKMGVDEDGRPYQDKLVKATGKYYRYYLDDPKIPEDWWVGINSLQSQDKERRGYPTQKPLELLDRIIKSSCPPDGIVLDAFCGCGTTIVSAQHNKRRWLGIDISPTSCREMAARLREECLLKEGVDFWVRDMPKTAEELRKYPPFEFENWAVNALNTVIAGGHAIANKVQVGDMGIDGRIYSATQAKEKRAGYDLFGDSDRWFPVQVKQRDKAGRPDIDAFEAAMLRQGREKGFFISFDFTKDAHQEIKRVFRESNLEIIPVTVQEILDEEVRYRV